MKDLIKKFDMLPHPEGGYYKEIYRSADSVRSGRVADERAAVTQIYFLLGKGQMSRFHKVAHDEIWHHYEGDPLTLILFDGKTLAPQTIGPGEAGYTAVIPAGTWQAAESTGEYTLVGCTVAPGFDFRDFSFLSDIPEDLDRFRALDTSFGRFI